MQRVLAVGFLCVAAVAGESRGAVPEWACAQTQAPVASAPGQVTLHAHNGTSALGPVTQVNFDSLTQKLGQNKPLLIAFFAPWCGHCQHFVMSENAPLKTLNQQLKDANGPEVVQFDTTQSIVPPGFVVEYIPTVYLVSQNGAHTKFEGNPNDLATLKSWAISGMSAPPTAAPSAVALAGAAHAAVPEWACSQVAAPTGQVHLHAKGNTSTAAATSPVTAVNLQSLSQKLNQNKPLLIAFFAPWCGHCQHFVMSENAPLNTLNQQLIEANGPEVLKFDTTQSPIPQGFVVEYIPTVYLVSANGAYTKFAGNPNDLATLKSWALAGMSSPPASFAVAGKQNLRAATKL